MVENKICEKVVTIPLSMFCELTEAKARINAFASYINASKYNVERKDCAAILGFELRGDEDE